MNDIKLTMKEDGSLAIPDLNDLRTKLAANLKSGILAALPEEYFHAQVDECFRLLTEPRQVGVTGDERCNECRRSGYRERKVCVHITKEGPSEVQEMILTQMRERVREAVAGFTKRWAEGGITDHDIVDRLERITQQSAKTYMQKVGEEIVQSALTALRGSYVNCQGQDGMGNICGASVMKGMSCGRCGAWA